MHNLLRILLVVLVFLTPFFVIPSELYLGVSKSVFVIAGAAILTIIWVMLELRRGSLSVARHMTMVAIFAFVVVAGIASVVHSSRLNSIFDIGRTDSFLYALIAAAVVYFASYAFRSRSQTFRALLAVTTIPAFLTLFELVKSMAGGTFGSQIMSLSTFTPAGSWNEFGLLCGLGVVLSASVLSLIRRKTTIWGLFLGLMLVSLLGLIIVNMQFAWILVGSFATLLFVYMFAFPLQRATETAADKDKNGAVGARRTVPVIPIVLIIVSFCFILLSRQANPFALLGSVPGFSYFNTFVVYNAEARPSLNTTIELGVETLKSGRIFGSGPGNFTEIWNRYKPAEINNTTLWAADFGTGYSTATTSFVTLGVLGLLAWIFITVGVLLLIFRSLFKTGTTVDRGVSLAIVIAVLYSLVVAWSYPIGLSWFVIMFFLIGLLVGHGRNIGIVKEHEYSYVKDPRVAFGAVLGLVAVLLVVLSLGYVSTMQAMASVQNLRASAALSENNVDAASAHVSRSIAFSPTDEAMRVLTDINLVRLAEYVNKINSEQGQQGAGQLSQADQQQFQIYIQAPIQSASQAIVLDKNDYVNWLTLGNVYRSLVTLRVDQAYEEALGAYAEARNLAPRNPNLLLILAELERARGNREEALKRIDEALALKPDYTEAYFLRAQLYIESDSLEEGIVAAELGALAARTNPIAYLQVGILKFNNKDYEGAADALERAVALDPGFANAQYFLARSYYELDRDAEALTIFEQLVITNPDNEDVQTYLERLRTGDDEPVAADGDAEEEGSDE